VITHDPISPERGVRFLAEAGEALAKSLDWEETLVQVARLAVPTLADWSIVDVLGDDGVTIEQVAVAAADPQKEDLLRELRRLYPPAIGSPQPAAQALRSGEPVVFAEFDEESLRSTVGDERHLELINRLAPRSTIAVPLVARARTIGALTLATSESGRTYGEAELVLATGLASRAALAVDNGVLFSREREARTRAEEAFARLRDLEVISEAALSHLDLDEVLEKLLDGIRKVMRTDTAVALLLDDTGEELVASWARGLEEEVEAGVRIPVGQGFAGRVAAGRAPVFIPDVERADLVNPLLVKRGLKSLLGVPLLVEGQLLGVLHVGSVEPRVFTEDDERTLQLLADRVALAIEQSRLYESERAASRRLEFLAEASELLGSTLDYATALQRLTVLAVPYLGDRCIVDIVGFDGKLERVAVAHADPDASLSPDLPQTSADVVRTGRPTLIREVTDDDLRAIGVSSLVSAPLIARGHALGAITLLSDDPERRFGDDDLAITRELARRAAVAVDNALLFAEAERRADAARVLEHIGDGVFMLDEHGVVRLWNRAAEAVTHLRADDVVGRLADEAIPGWKEIAGRIPVATAPAVARSVETLPLELPDGELWLSIAAVGFAEGTVYAFRDMTEDRVLEELRSDFVSTVSHELRTPLAAIYGAALTLQRDDLPLDEAQRANLMDVIATESDRLARTVNDILWASRLDADRMQLELGSHDPRYLTQAVIEAAKAHLRPGVELTLSCERDLPPVAGDPDKVRQVLTNLVDNAVKYSPEGGRVEVDVSRREHAVRFSVADEGLGIPQSEQRRIFDKFYRVDPNLSRGVGGTGLGLYISRELVRRMNGTIWVESREGEGSQFSFELPVATT
jgi:signal transduction histidine kinase/putative methionine-R-sulfoxide reductase with GAF domain